MWRIPFTSLTVRSSIAIAYSLSMLYNVGFFMQMMILPYAAKELSISDTDFGLIQTFFGAMQMIGGPIYGYLIRQFGIQKALVICYSCTTASSLLIFTARDKVSLYVSILPSIFMHGQQGHQTLLSAFTMPGKERTNAFGRMGITFGLGFVFAPLTSTLSRKLFSEKAPLIISALISATAISIVLTQLRMQKQDTNEEKDDKRKEKERALNVQIIIDMARRRGVAVTFAKKCALTAPMFFVFSIMQVHLINTFQVTPEMNSFIQMFVGMLIMLNNGFAIVWLRKRFNEDYLLTSGAAALLLANVLLTQWYTLWLVFCTLPFICLGLSLVSTVADSLLTSQVQLDEQALILGASQATNSLIRTFGPAAAGYMLEHYGFAIFGLIGAAISTIVLLHDLSPIPTLVKSTTSNHSSTSNDREAKRHQ